MRRARKKLSCISVARKILIAAVFAAVVLPVRGLAQSGQIELSASRLTIREAIREIESKTEYRIVYNKLELSEDKTVSFGATRMSVVQALNKMLADTGLTYNADEKYVVIHRAKGPVSKSNVTVSATRVVSGTVTDADDGQPMEGVEVEIINLPEAKATTFANGRFRIEGVPSGNTVAKLTAPDGNIRFSEIVVPASTDVDVSLSMSGQSLMIASSAPEVPDASSTSVKTTAYFNPMPTDNTIHAFADEPKTNYSFIRLTEPAKYRARAAVKTNLLYLATTTLNMAFEVGIAPRWTLDIYGGLNLWDLNERKGGIRHWLLQPEARYWFCNRFEKHFIGLHLMGGQYQIQDIDLAPLGNDLTGKRYDGWGVGAGVSYGYHLPMGQRWAWEFTAGLGYIYLSYDKYNCGECDNYTGNRRKHYFGPTKVGASLIFMIR